METKDRFLQDIRTTSEFDEDDWFSAMDLAIQMDVSRSTVNKHLRKWNRKGLLESDFRDGERIDGNKCQVPVYRIKTDDSSQQGG